MSKPTKAQNPDMDFGFYATFPRIVRTGYKEVSAVQKWLYVCLKDLAGDDGTCYRTIRALVEETGLSAGMISESILVLHKASLIHAEKKKRSTGGKEVWHISIVDIWKKNGEAHPTKRSLTEQTAPYIDVQSTNVHHMNDNPTECSPTEHKRSPHEQECSLSETEVITITRPVSKTNTEARTEGTGNVAHRELPTPAPDFSANQRNPYKSDGNDGHSCNPALGDINGHSQVRSLSATDPARARASGVGETWEVANEPDASSRQGSRIVADPGADSDAGVVRTAGVAAELSTSQGSSPQASAKVEPRPMNRAAHIDCTFQWLDAVRKHASGDPLASYVANGANKKRIADLIDACSNTPNEVNEINVALAWMALWNGGQWSNGKSWQDPGMLTVKAFCEHYGESLDRARAKPQRKKPATDAPVNFTQLRLAAEAKARAQQGAYHG